MGITISIIIGIPISSRRPDRHMIMLMFMLLIKLMCMRMLVRLGFEPAGRKRPHVPSHGARHADRAGDRVSGAHHAP